MITVLSANASLDYTYEVESFRAGGYHHPSRSCVTPGGKGVNVARVLRALDNEVTVTGFAGGYTGDFITAELRRQGVRCEFVRIAEASRTCFAVVDAASRTTTQVDETGPLVAPSEAAMLKRQWARLLGGTRVCVISGSAPRGIPFDYYTDMIASAREHKVPVIADLHEPYLSPAIEALPHVIKPNLNELEQYVGGPLEVPGGVVQTAREIVAKGISLVVVSLGRRGAIAVTAKHGSVWVRPPDVETVSEVGSGDAMVAGLVHASVRKMSLLQRLAWAVAAGSANAMKIGARMCSAEEVAGLISGIQVQVLEPPANGGAMPSVENS